MHAHRRVRPGLEVGGAAEDPEGDLLFPGRLPRVQHGMVRQVQQEVAKRFGPAERRALQDPVHLVVYFASGRRDGLIPR